MNKVVASSGNSGNLGNRDSPWADATEQQSKAIRHGWVQRAALAKPTNLGNKIAHVLCVLLRRLDIMTSEGSADPRYHRG